MKETSERARERTGLICIGTFYTEMAACGFLNTLGRAGPKGFSSERSVGLVSTNRSVESAGLAELPSSVDPKLLSVSGYLDQARRCLIRYEFGYYKVYDPGP